MRERGSPHRPLLLRLHIRLPGFGRKKALLPSWSSWPVHLSRLLRRAVFTFLLLLVLGDTCRVQHEFQSDGHMTNIRMAQAGQGYQGARPKQVLIMFMNFAHDFFSCTASNWVYFNRPVGHFGSVYTSWLETVLPDHV